MKNKFTPGKWLQSHREIPDDEDGMYATQVYTDDGETIATIAWYPKPKVKEIIDGKQMLTTGTYREANAKLIAAAPDLLEALQKLMSVYEQKGQLLSFDVNIAREAIKKATE